MIICNHKEAKEAYKMNKDINLLADTLLPYATDKELFRYMEAYENKDNKTTKALIYKWIKRHKEAKEELK